MMPWEHAIIGYIVFSIFVHLLYRDSPTGWETIVVVFGSILPDLIDKPLAWEYEIFQSGYALGHSIFFVSILSILLVLIAYNRGCPRIGWAFAIGLVMHLPADLVPRYVRSGEWNFAIVLWPVRVAEGPTGQGLTDGFVQHTMNYFQEFANLQSSPSMQIVFGLLLMGFLLWIYDGMPILRELVGATRRLAE